MREAIATHMSLVPVSGGGARAEASPRQRWSTLLAAQLLAGRLDAPVARRLRRAAPGDAAALYREGAARVRDAGRSGWTA